MELLSPKAIATSKVFCFFVGPDQRAFTIHSALVAKQSAALKALANGQFKESAECSVLCDDVDETSFASFWQFAYTGNYTAPEPTPDHASDASANSSYGGDQHPADLPETFPIGPPPPPPPPPPAPLEDEPVLKAFPDATEIPAMRQLTLGERKMMKKRKKRLAGSRPEQKLGWDDQGDVPDSSACHIPTNVNIGAAEIKKIRKQVRDLFVHHARVYVLGDRYGIKRLIYLSFDKLSMALEEVDMDEEGQGEVVSLLRYCFGDLVPDALRELSVQYVARYVEKFWTCVEFQELVEENGILSRALVGAMLFRLR